MDDTQLTIFEQSELQQCEAVIEKGLRTFVDVGGALLKIRDSKLYRQDYSTFEEYCRDRWDMSRIHAHRMIEAASVTNNLLPIGNKLPENEAQARPLTKLEPEQQREVWSEVVETAPEGKITGRFVEEVANKRVGYTCPDCGEHFDTEVWHCELCGHHWTMDRDECWNCQNNGKPNPHVSHNSGENEWYTPSEFIRAARLAMGSIDTDPASSDIANETVQAETYYTIQDNGLIHKWYGNVWLNPPYSQPQVTDFTKLTVAKYLDGEIKQACVLVNNATETEFFQRMLGFCSAVCFPKSRIKFVDPQGKPSGAPLQGQAIVYFGNNVTGFTEAFSELGKVLYAS